MSSFNITLIAIIILAFGVLVVKYLDGDFDNKISFKYNYSSQVSANNKTISVGNKMIQINGKTFYGNNLNISNGKIIIDGKVQSSLSDFDEKEINITIEGDVVEVSTEIGNITVNGNVSKNVKNTNGDINVSGSVGGDVKITNGSVECGNVNGDVDTTNGNIKYKK